MKRRRPLVDTVEDAADLIASGESNAEAIADRLDMTVAGLHQALYRASRRGIEGAADARLAIFHHKTRPPRLTWETP